MHAPLLSAKNQELWLDTNRRADGGWVVLNQQGGRRTNLQCLSQGDVNDQQTAQSNRDLAPEQKEAEANGGYGDDMHELGV